MLLNGWTAFVIVEKKTPDVSKSQPDRKLWICLDPRGLKWSYWRGNHTTPNPLKRSWQDSMAWQDLRLRTSTKDTGWWSSIQNLGKYTTMALDIGRFQWTRLPMGSIVGSGRVSKEARCHFPWYTRCHRNCWQTWWYMEKLTWSMTDIWSTFSDICRKNTLMLNPDKMQFRLPQVSVSLDINGVPRGSVQIQRRLQQSRGWICLKMSKLCEVF